MYFSYALPASSEAEFADQPKSTLLGRVQRDTQDWHAPVPTIVGSATVESIGVRGCYDKEPTAKARDGNVWMLGHAAHPMCPFQGQGANMAMLDAIKLAELFTTGAPDGQAVAALEADIVRRGRKAVLESRASAKRSHLTNPLLRMNRDLSFRLANVFIQLFSRPR